MFDNLTGDATPTTGRREVYWLPFIRLTGKARWAAEDFASLARPVCRGWFWLPSAVAAGAAPFLVSWRLGIPGHQAVSAALLVSLCLACAREGAWVKGVGVIAVAFGAHCALVIAAAHVDSAHVSALLPGADAYWQKQLLWIRTGQDPEYDVSTWWPAHLQLLAGTILYSYSSLGGLTFYEGFREVDLMNFYNAQLVGVSRNHLRALALGWHIWSALRGLGYVIISFEVISLSLRRLTGVAIPVRWRRWAGGLALILADGIAKFFLLSPVRDELFNNLK